MKKIIALILCVILFTGSAGFCDDKLNVAVTHPWLALLVSFIGGPEVNVIPIRVWNDKGDLILSDKGRVLSELEDETKIIALDSNDADDSGINDSRKKFTLRCLYSPFPANINSLYDPSVIPLLRSVY